MIIHLNGWQGAGKRTIGELIATSLRAHFIHNHLLHDVALVCAGAGSPERWVLYETVRSAAYAALSRRPPGDIFVMTNGLCINTPREEAAWKHVVNLAIARGVPLVPVVLVASVPEICRRVQSAERVGKKHTDPADLLRQMNEGTLQKPDVAELLEIDVTEMSPSQAANAIIGHVEAQHARLRPATHRHLVMRSTS